MSVKYVLASASPRRRELLGVAGLEFEVVVSNADESVPEGISPEDAAVLTAEKKAEAVLELCPDACVIGADTTVVLDGEVMGKPADRADAVRMLAGLSGREHNVLTGVCLLYKDKKTTFVQRTAVRFYELTEEEINDYVDSGEPMDKAGAYGIQGLGCKLVEGIEGDYFNVVGLPVARVMRELKRLVQNT